MGDAAGTSVAASVAIGQTVAAYSFFLPRLPDVREAPRDDTTMVNNVRLGQVAAGAVSMTVAGLLTWLTRSPIPVITTLVIAAVLAAVYQVAMFGGF
jgi:hypothetical protein